MSSVTIDLDAPLYEYYQKGIIQALFRKGNPPPMFYRYYEVYLRHFMEHNTTRAVELTADECGVSEKTIWKVLRTFEPAKASKRRA